jgi:hypothetical protein
VNVPLFVAGCLAILAAGIHGLGGEVWVVRKLSPGTLPSTRLGGARMTLAMIHVAWHLATIALIVIGIALLVAAATLEGDTARAVGVVSAAAFTGFAIVGLGLGAAYSPRSFVTHPGPAAFAVIAALAWWGAL